MDAKALQDLLERPIATWENEVAELKQAGDGFSTDDIGRYFGALANEANLRNVEAAWLVFGVHDKTRRVVCTDYRPQPERLHALKMQIAENTEPRIGLRQIHELQHAGGRVVLPEIPAAPRGIPIAWKGHYYARAGESLVPLGLDKLDAIRQQTLAQDWTAQPVAGATLDDLDPSALEKAREAFARRHANRLDPAEVMDWPLATWLDRAHVTQHGRITRTALLLLGKARAAWRLSPHPALLTWKLAGPERAYAHFGPPFLLSTSALYQRIRNIQLRLLPQDYLARLGQASRQDINQLLLTKLSNALDARQKERKIGNLLTKPRRHGLIVNRGVDTAPRWQLVVPAEPGKRPR
ncbi:ATP-binding protein [Pseudorhodoferax sp.]|uniref:ATP-binding protein n=1 Tax=Pseudorhodoferax sp. TaxID=1993553 RepID=UPI0039E3AC18